MIVDLLWDSLKRDPHHKDRRQTGWGTKTQEGLIACIERVAAMPKRNPKVKCQHCDEGKPGRRTTAGHEEQCEFCGGTNAVDQL